MPRRPTFRAKRDVVIGDYAAGRGSVPILRGFLPTAEAVALGIGVGRVVIGVSFLIAPTFSVRMLGVDTGTAKRMTFLARMAAARDIGLGGGTLAAGTGPAVVPWLLAGVAADAVDATAIAGALRSGTARGVPAAGIVTGALAAAGAGGWAAVQLRRR